MSWHALLITFSHYHCQGSIFWMLISIVIASGQRSSSASPLWDKYETLITASREICWIQSGAVIQVPFCSEWSPTKWFACGSKLLPSDAIPWYYTEVNHTVWCYSENMPCAMLWYFASMLPYSVPLLACSHIISKWGVAMWCYHIVTRCYIPCDGVLVQCWLIAD